MLQYKSVTLEDKEWISACMKAANLRGSEFTFANLFDWREIYDFKIARFEDMLIINRAETIPILCIPSAEEMFPRRFPR